MSAVGKGGGEASKGRWGGIVRMTFELGTKSVEGVLGQGVVGQMIEPVENPQPDGDAAAHASRARDVSLD